MNDFVASVINMFSGLSNNNINDNENDLIMIRHDMPNTYEYLANLSKIQSINSRDIWIFVYNEKVFRLHAGNHLMDDFTYADFLLSHGCYFQKKIAGSVYYINNRLKFVAFSLPELVLDTGQIVRITHKRRFFFEDFLPNFEFILES